MGAELSAERWGLKRLGELGERLFSERVATTGSSHLCFYLLSPPCLLPAPTPNPSLLLIKGESQRTRSAQNSESGLKGEQEFF